MSGRLPIVATAIVALAVATMIALGFWQLQRKAEKEAQLARYERAQSMSSAVSWPRTAAAREAALYRHSQVNCVRVLGIAPRAGRSLKGESGWAHLARCVLPDGDEALVAIGWSSDPARRTWAGGTVGGFIGPAGEGVKLVAAPPKAGLAPLAPPDPRELPNNHLSYAVQWFAFAATALLIYALALRGRRRATPR
jgi:surfeit locus 1 family protein